MKKAKVVTKKGTLTTNGHERFLELRLGKKGKGKVLGSVTYWPWSLVSCEKAEEIIIQIAKKHNVELIW